MTVEYKCNSWIQTNKPNIGVIAECRHNSRKQMNGLNATITTKSRQMSQMQAYQLNGGLIFEYKGRSRLQANDPNVGVTDKCMKINWIEAFYRMMTYDFSLELANAIWVECVTWYDEWPMGQLAYYRMYLSGQRWPTGRVYPTGRVPYEANKATGQTTLRGTWCPIGRVALRDAWCPTGRM